MKNLPIIVGFGGINAAGRSSGFHNFKRMIAENLSKKDIKNTWLDLANRMNLLGDDKEINDAVIQKIKQGTLVRKIRRFDPEKVAINSKAYQASSFTMRKSSLPDPIPENWVIDIKNEDEVIIHITNGSEILVPCTKNLDVSSGGDIPEGFDPATLYNARHHPLGIQMAVYAASDAINSLGFDWDEVLKHIDPDEVSVYAGSAIAQADDCSLAGLMKQPLLGNRITSKMLALSLPEMPADFVNSYIINSVGTTGANIGACASFLYNLRQGCTDIQTGKAKVVIVGGSDAPITPEFIDGFSSMGALATDSKLKKLDDSNRLDHTRACRPFSDNCGFVIGNSAQYVILMLPELAIELGATIYGSVADVYINADANKHSISAPGVGNYVTFAKATSLARAILGDRDLKNTFVQTHGTGTPQNRVTESHVINETAKTFNIENWVMVAVKSYLGHSFGTASADQLISTLGVWQYQCIPGIKTIDHLASDIHNSNLYIPFDHYSITDREMHAALINSKGFGGNNATGVILSPDKTMEILKKKFSSSVLKSYQIKNTQTRDKINQVDEKICNGVENVIYRFGDYVMDGTDVEMTTEKLNLSQFSRSINLKIKNPYS